MRALFPKWANTAYRLGLAGGALALVGLVIGPMYYVRSPWNTASLDPPEQPVAFDHRHHVVDDGIDCIYCHRGAETADVAGVPATDVCMGCHAQIRTESPLLEPVRRSYFEGQPLRWNRVHDLGDFAYFSHAVHVQRGIGCVACHGRVDRMARVYVNTALTMEFCIDCHRNATRFASARSLAPDADPLLGSYPEELELAALHRDLGGGDHRLTPLITCSACHR